MKYILEFSEYGAYFYTKDSIEKLTIINWKVEYVHITNVIYIRFDFSNDKTNCIIYRLVDYKTTILNSANLSQESISDLINFTIQNQEILDIVEDFIMEHAPDTSIEEFCHSIRNIHKVYESTNNIYAQKMFGANSDPYRYINGVSNNMQTEMEDDIISDDDNEKYRLENDEDGDDNVTIEGMYVVMDEFFGNSVNIIMYINNNPDDGIRISYDLDTFKTTITYGMNMGVLTDESQNKLINNIKNDDALMYNVEQFIFDNNTETSIEEFKYSLENMDIQYEYN